MGEPDEFAGKQVTVMGLGRFGGGVGVTRFLVDRGADVLVTDQEPADKLTKSIEKIQDLINAGSVELRLGEHNVSDFTTCDLVVVNPAVKPGNRCVRAAEAAGIEVTTEMRLLVQRLPNRLRTIGVTGSAGKSTVTAMIGHVLGKVFEKGGEPSTTSRQVAKSPSKTSKVWVGGNIGVSLLPDIDQIGGEDWVVLELSSFMLERLREDQHFPGWSPGIAIVTNLSANHLDWHGCLEEYERAKQVILHYQASGNKAILDQSVGEWPIAEGVAVDRITSVYSHDTKPLQVPGSHNRRNAMFVASLGEMIALGNGYQVLEALADFPGLPHRLQRITERDGVRYFNDSKCTTPEAAMLAVQAFMEGGEKPCPEKGPEKGVGSRFSLEEGGSDEDVWKGNDSRPLFRGAIHLILGGNKGSDMKPLADLAASKCKAVYTIGALGETIAGLVDTAGEAASAGTEVVRCGDLETAVEEIQKRVKPGDVVLLSPACASWDQFENYEQRGERFIELVTSVSPPS